MKPLRILHIEDDPSVAEAIGIMLKRKGHIVDHTDLGEDGVEMGQQGQYDLIITDGDLPDTNGHAVISQLNNSQVLTPVLVVSANLGLIDNIKADTTIFNPLGYLPKPIKMAELYDAIDKLMTPQGLPVANAPSLQPSKKQPKLENN